MKTEYVKNARRAFLDDMVAFYHRRNRGSFCGGCQYSPTSFSPGCAVGRHVPNKKICLQWDCSTSGTTVSNPSIFFNLPPSLQVLGWGFARAVQMLHDTPVYWNDDGLSIEGLAEVRALERTFEL